MNIAEAHKVLAEVLGNDTSFNVGMQTWRHAYKSYGDPNGEVVHSVDVQYSVYDGNRHYYGVTVEQAVRACVEAHTLAQQDPDEALAEMPEHDTEANHKAVDCANESAAKVKADKEKDTAQKAD